ncbi:hypothetical protein J1P26_24825 [Neobacillus sp. MM2021_6]|uniref:hypothetical protein n=1 Tax=Bacillaceae TaxID=186817 RepID=UPI00140ABDF4|nr:MULTISPECIES: hypothetical protein [Bacillaceae]MBO0962901.1 hypothetical protein [Neobacillus sp. MM2021_6]NHC21456.1 hypothetical protein [Bacillus sp. MM2020_4]
MVKKRRKILVIALAILIFFIVNYFLQLNWISVSNETVYLEDLPERSEDLVQKITQQLVIK